MNQAEPVQSPGGAKTRRPIAHTRAFNLIYLVWYFFPWLFKAPTLTDIAVAGVAIVAFLPIFWACFEKQSLKALPLILAMEALAWACAPFHGMQGTFHIYACVHAGFQRPAKRAVMLIAALTLAYVAMGFALDLPKVFEIGFVVFLGLVTGVSCMAGGEAMERQKLVERARVLDQQLAAQAERERIARDLHDMLGQTLTVAALKAEIADKMLDRDLDRARAEIADIRAAAREALKNVRSVVVGLNATTLDQELDQARAACEAAGVGFTVLGPRPELDARTDMTLGLAVREAVTNIVRHSGANAAHVRFAETVDGVSVEVSDNGRGGALVEGSGLKGLRRRLQDLGGRLSVNAEAGVRLTFDLPLGPGVERAS
ncbi:MAG: sensor histidine kinase [Maricaulaceae bacterium]